MLLVLTSCFKCGTDCFFLENSRIELLSPSSKPARARYVAGPGDMSKTVINYRIAFWTKKPWRLIKKRHLSSKSFINFICSTNITLSLKRNRIRDILSNIKYILKEMKNLSFNFDIDSTQFVRPNWKSNIKALIDTSPPKTLEMKRLLYGGKRVYNDKMQYFCKLTSI